MAVTVNCAVCCTWAVIAPGTVSTGGVPGSKVIADVAMLAESLAVIVMDCWDAETPAIAWKLTVETPLETVTDGGSVSIGLLLITANVDELEAG